MVDEIDIGRVVERALALQEATEIHERLAQIREAETSLDRQLRGENSRASAIAIAGELDIPQAYAERALEQLYPSSDTLRTWEKKMGVLPHKNVATQEAYNSAVQLVHCFMTELVHAVLVHFPDIRLYLLYRTGLITHKHAPTELVFSPPTLVTPDLIFADPFSYCKNQEVQTKYHNSLSRPTDYHFGASIDFSMPPPNIPLSAKKSLLDGLSDALFGSGKQSDDEKCLGRITITLSHYNASSEFPKLNIFEKPVVNVDIYAPPFLPVSAAVVERHQTFLKISMIRHYTVIPPT